MGEKLASEPHWLVNKISLHQVKVRGLVEGVTAADISACPYTDPCGMASAKGCSKCHDPHEHNRGCLCGAPPGTVISANTTACPAHDKCGLLSARGCSTCPGDIWDNQGCTCRIPLSFGQFFSSVRNFWELLTGKHAKPVSFVVRVNITVANNNLIGATTEPGTIEVSHLGHVLGSTAVPSLTIGGFEKMDIGVKAEVDNIDTELGLLLVNSIKAHRGRLPVLATGSVVAKVFAFVPLKVNFVCNVLTDVMQGGMVLNAETNCTYKYSL